MSQMQIVRSRPLSRISAAMFIGFLALGSTIALSACGRQADEGALGDSAAAPSAVATTPPVIPPRDTVGSGSINWTLADLQNRLRAAGLDAIAVGEVRQPFLGAPGMRFKLPVGELQAYVYADAGALSRDTDVLDTVTVSPPTMMIEWLLPPTLIISNNLALILLTTDPELRKNIRAAVRPDLDRHDRSK